jgi:PIN domain nuclease of toxin-antitoxin system
VDLLLDTHALLWWLAGDTALSPAARSAIDDPANTVFVSAASAWEIATKVRIGKLPGAAAIVADLPDLIQAQGFTPLPITVADGQLAGTLPNPHRDPFDRMLIAQALRRQLILLSNERLFDAFGVRRLWEPAGDATPPASGRVRTP